jgi:chromatin remodeling complex protein RSC6
MSDTFVLPLSSNNQTQNLRNSSLRGKFFIPTKISDRLSVFLGKEKGTEMTRMDVSREIYKYIGLNNLQDNKNKIIINPDTKISTLFGLNNGDELTYFNIQKYIGLTSFIL